MSGSDLFVDPDDKIWQFVSSIAVDEGVVLYDLMRPRPNSLRVFLDKPKAEEGKKGSGITSAECSSVCRRLMHSLVVEGENLGLSAEPELEVSSPGLERELRLTEHFTAAIGSHVKVTAKNGQITGLLVDFSDELLTIKETTVQVKPGKKSPEKEPQTLPFSEVKKAQMIFV